MPVNRTAADLPAEAPRTYSRRMFAGLGACAIAGLAAGCSNRSVDDAAGEPAAPTDGTDSASGEVPAQDEAPAEVIPGTHITEEDLAARIDDIVAGLSLAQQAGQLFIVRPESVVNGDASIPDDYLDGVVMPDETFASAFGEVQPGGVCLFDKNLVSPDQARSLTSAVDAMARQASRMPAFVAVDEEGGVVARIANNAAFGVPNVGAMGDLGVGGDAQAAYDAGATIADYLGDLGFNLDFAPVCDVVDPAGNSVMTGRSFGLDAASVGTLAQSLAGGLLDGGLLCCAKHFPGIGLASGDSHDGLISTDRTVEQMAAEEWLPFSAAIDREVPMVMVGHIACGVACGNNVPASVNATVIGDWLRGRLGFDGVVVTDSLEMGALANMGWGESAVAAIASGADVVLLPVNLRVALAAVLAALEDGTLPRERFDEAVRRVARCKLIWEARRVAASV